MNYLSNRCGFFYSSLQLLLTVYLCLALIGCGKPPPDRRRSSSSTTMIIDLGIHLDSDPPQEEYYYYKMTLNLDELENNSTNVRISLHGSHLEGDEVKKTGPVYDDRFFELFFANLNRALKIEKGGATP